MNKYEDEFQDSFEQLLEKGEDENPTSESATAHNDSDTNISELDKTIKRTSNGKKESISTPGNRKRKGKFTDIAQTGFENPSWTATSHLYK